MKIWRKIYFIDQTPIEKKKSNSDFFLTKKIDHKQAG